MCRALLTGRGEATGVAIAAEVLTRYRTLDAEFRFTFDPCPFPLPDGFDGLTCAWGASNYVNPPFGSIIHEGRKKGPTAWVRKALAELASASTLVDRIERIVAETGQTGFHFVDEAAPPKALDRLFSDVTAPPASSFSALSVCSLKCDRMSVGSAPPVRVPSASAVTTEPKCGVPPLSRLLAMA